MNANDPRNQPPNIQMTPVGFSPPSSPGVGVTVLPGPKPPRQFSLAIPLAILLLTLIFTTGRDMVVVNKRMTAINDENAPVLDKLKQASKETEFLDSLKDGLAKLAPNDPVAAQITREFFPVKPPPAKTETVPAKSAAPPAGNK